MIQYIQVIALELCVFFSIFYATQMEETKIQDFQTLREFHKSISSVQSFHPTDAIKHLHSLHDKTLLDVPVGNEVPVLHQLLNLYFQVPSIAPTHSTQIRSYLVQVMELCLDYGIDVDQHFRNDPSTLFKSIVLRELSVSDKISQQSDLFQMITQDVLTFNEMFHKKSSDISKTFIQLYGIPCEVVPLSKLLLHADTLIRKRGQIEEITIDYVMNLLLHASPGAGSKPSTKMSDLVKYSSTFYNSILLKLGVNSDNDGIRLIDVIKSLDEVALITHQNMLHHLTYSSSSNSGRDRGGIESTRNEILIHVWGEILNDSDTTYRRNLFHHLFMSGAVNMLSNLIHHLESIISFSSTEVKSELLQSLSSSLQSRDIRGFLPYHYAVLRYGIHSTLFTNASQLYQMIDYHVDMNEVSSLFSASAMISSSSLICENNEMNINGTCSVDMNKEKKIGSNSITRHSSSGGWDEKRIHLEEEQRGDNPTTVINNIDTCDIIERFDEKLPSSIEFYEKYVKTSTPVIFRNINSFSSPLRQVFDKISFLKRYGQYTVPISTIPYAGSFGFQASMATLVEVANLSMIDLSSNSTPIYAFTTAQASWRERLQEDIPYPSCIATLEINGQKLSEALGTIETQFYLGPAGSGAPVHYHGHAVNSLAYGEKKWFLYPPSEAFYSTLPASDFVLYDHKATNARICTQRAGDIIFVPSLWGHGTLNTKQSIGVAHEFSVEPFCSE